MIEELMDQAVADNDVLTHNNEMGDNFSIPREVDFYFIAENQENADIVAGFINDYAYGQANIEDRDDGKLGVKVLIEMPITQPVILSVSSFMAVIAKMFGAEYVGWGSVIQTNKN